MLPVVSLSSDSSSPSATCGCHISAASKLLARQKRGFGTLWGERLRA